MSEQQDIESWLRSRDHARPFTGSKAALAAKAHVSETTIYDASWGSYKTIPAALAAYIDQAHNTVFRNEQRKQFSKLDLDWPVPFRGFYALAEYWEVGLSTLSKCFCVQRPVMMKFDKAPSLKFTELNEVLAQCSPPGYFSDVVMPFMLGGVPADRQPATPRVKHDPLEFLARINAAK